MLPGTKIRPTVGIVDDDPNVHSELVEAIPRHMTIETFRNGDAAIRYPQRASIDLWIINTRLPDVSGFELCRQLATTDRSPAIYLMGDQYDESEERRSYLCGATVYVCRPVRAAWLQNWTGCRASQVDSCREVLSGA